MLKSLRGFLPWIAYGVIATQSDVRVGSLVGLVIAAGLLVLDHRARKAWDEMVLEISAVVFFALLTVFSFAAPHSPLTPYGPALVNAWLAVTAWGSLAVRRPFTLGVARTMTPPEVWQSPIFYRTNVVITAVWAAGFTVAAIALGVLLHSAPHATAPVLAIKIGSFVIPAIFTVGYPKVVRARYAV